MDIHLLAVDIATLLSGLVSGVFVCIVLSVLPVLRRLEPGDYVKLHTMIGRGFHPVMPALVAVLLVAQIAALLTESGSLPAPAVAVVLVIGVQIISHFGNEPLNRIARATDSAAITADWADPRPMWARWHYLRTLCAVACFTGNVIALS